MSADMEDMDLVAEVWKMNWQRPSSNKHLFQEER